MVKRSNRNDADRIATVPVAQLARMARAKGFVRPFAASVVALVCAVAFANSAKALTKLEGEYQITLDARKTQRAYSWDYDYNNNDTWTGAQFRVFTVPFANTEAFLRFEADWNDRNSYRRPMFQYRESHLRYNWDKPNWGADVRLFQRQDRYWVERHLAEIISPGNLTDGGNSEGIRADLRGLGNTQAILILSDYSGQSQPNTGQELGAPVGTDDAQIFRARREFLDDRFRLGFTYGRRNDRERVDPGRKFTEVWATDFRYSFGSELDLLVEYADTRARGAEQHIEGEFFDGPFVFGRPDHWLPTDSELRAEFRTIRLGNPKTGYYNIVPSVWYIGRGYVNPLENFGANNPLGGVGADDQGFFLNSWYLIPGRAITLTTNYAARERLYVEQRQVRSFYAELYTEYVNGFTSKFSYYDRWDRTRTDRGATVSQNRDVFAEVQVETQLAWMRVQGKIKDIDTEFQKELASLETSVNLRSNLKLYSRYTFGNDPTRLRKGIFSQLQYRPKGNMEVFFEYGPGWIGDTPNPVDDGDLSGSAEQEEMFKLTIKGTF